jgi:hypothetical protein
MTARGKGHTRNRRKERHRASVPGLSPCSWPVITQINQSITPEVATRVMIATITVYIRILILVRSIREVRFVRAY